MLDLHLIWVRIGHAFIFGSWVVEVEDEDPKVPIDGSLEQANRKNMKYKTIPKPELDQRNK